MTEADHENFEQGLPRGMKASAVLAARSILNAPQTAVSVPLEDATVPPAGISMSPDRHGSGATRIEADLSINRGEKPDA